MQYILICTITDWDDLSSTFEYMSLRIYVNGGSSVISPARDSSQNVPWQFQTLSRETAYCWARGHPPWVGKQQTGHQHHKRNLREKNARPNTFQPITRRTVEDVSTIYVLSFYMKSLSETYKYYVWPVFSAATLLYSGTFEKWQSCAENI